MLVEGEWKTERQQEDEEGRFLRPSTTFRDFVTADGSSGYQAEPGRYHLYISWACPWAHRTAIMRKLKGLEGMISLSTVHPVMGEGGWVFSDAYPDQLNDASYLREIYTKADPNYTGRVTTPVLWDKKEETIVNNESREIMRMFDTEFEDFAKKDANFYPEDLRDEIDRTLDELYEPVNNGVYRAGFATEQPAYEEAVLDPVYHGHFKCNLRRIVDYPNLWGYLRDLYQQPGVAETVNLVHIKRHYYVSHEKSINPTGIVPKGPILNLNEPHDRDRLTG